MSEAWHSIMTTDPLADSDEEPHDEHARLDYSALLLFFTDARFQTNNASSVRRREILQRYTGLGQIPD